MKKLLIISTIIVLLICGVYAYYSNTPIASQPEPLKSIGVAFRDFFPLGGEPVATDTTTPPDSTTPDTSEPLPPVVEKVDPLVQLSTTPIAGFGFTSGEKTVTESASLVATSTGIKKSIVKISLIRYIEKATGHIFERELPGGSETQVANTTLPGAQEALVAGSTALYRYLDTNGHTIKTFSGILPTPEADGSFPEMKGTFLTDDTLAITLSPDLKKIFTLIPFDSGVMGNVSELDGTKKTKVFDSAFTEWLPQWVGATTVVLTTKASGLAPGFAYLLDTNKKSFSRLMGNISGLTTNTSPSVKYSLYSTSITGGFESNIFDVLSGSKIPLTKNTLPEKCTWSKTSLWVICAVPDTIPTGIYPDIWYQGRVSFTDTFWKIDAKTGVAVFIESPFKDKKLSLDAINLALDPDESHLYFIDKTKENLWQLSLSTAQ